MQTQLAIRPVDLAVPVVVPTRRRLDRRFPSLGLTITTTAPWVEVILCTDPGLLDPARSGSRTEANFYASRTHGGLTPTVSGRARYVVPAGVVAKLASAADAVWYLAVAYPDSTGQGGVPSVASGASGSVAVDAALAHSLGASSGRGLGLGLALRPGVSGGLSGGLGTGLGTDSRQGSGRRTGRLGQSLATGPEGYSPDGDRLEGEDGADLPASRGGGLSTAMTLNLAPDSDDRLQGEDGADLSVLRVGGLSTALTAPNTATNSDDRLEGEDGADLGPTAYAPLRPALPPVGEPGRLPAQNPEPSALESQLPSQLTSGTPHRPGPRDYHFAGNSHAPATLSLSEYDDGWESLEQGTVPALASDARDQLDEEYPDIDWSGVFEDPYGDVPGHASLEQVPPSTAAAPVGPPADPGNTRAVGPVATPRSPDGAPVALPASPPTLALTPEDQRRVVELTLAANGSAYAAVVADGAFRGRYGPGHKAYQRFHTGLSYGIAEFSQDSGALGQLLALMAAREPETFEALFGPAFAELLQVTTAPGPSSEHVPGGRGPRVQPVAGADLWEEPWLSRFRSAGAVPAFRAAQNQLAAELHLVGMIPVAAGFGLTTQRALCMVLDRSVSLGENGAKRWIADTVGPVSTPTVRAVCLSALGLDSIEAFQAAVPGLQVDGEFGPVTHATLTAALRRLGPASPVQIPSVEQMIATMALRAQSEQGTARLLRLAGDPEIGDAPMGGAQ